MSDKLKIEIEIGEDGRDYQGGNFLNSLDELAKYFIGNKRLKEEDIVNLLVLYADSISEEE